MSTTATRAKAIQWMTLGSGDGFFCPLPRRGEMHYYAYLFPVVRAAGGDVVARYCWRIHSGEHGIDTIATGEAATPVDAEHAILRALGGGS